jgi:hypothetical protein
MSVWNRKCPVVEVLLLMNIEGEYTSTKKACETLSGRARTWFDREIADTWGDEDQPMGLADVLCQMYERFINIANIHAPMEAFLRADALRNGAYSIMRTSSSITQSK